MGKWRYDRSNDYEEELTFDDEYTTFEKIKSNRMKEGDEGALSKKKNSAKKRFNNYKEY
jgi:hypothetical protein